MEEQTIDSGMNQEMGLTNAARGHLMETAKWAKFLAIVGFIMIGILVIVAFSLGGIMSSIPEFSEVPGMADMGGAFITVMYLFIALLYFFPTLYLYRFATKTQTALAGSNAEGLGSGLENLKSTFKFMGIIMAIFIGLYALIFLFAIIAALTGLAA